MTTLLVCGDCRSHLEKIGGVLDATIKEIGLGRACELRGKELHVHSGLRWQTHRADRQATNGVVVDAVPDGIIFDEEIVNPAADEYPAGTTELAHGLLCAWSTGKPEELGDDLAIDRAVDIAQKLLSRTKGR